MPRFYMLELADEDAARAEALAGARDLMAGELRNGELNLSSFIKVEDEAHRLLFTLHFSEAVKLTPRP